MPRSNNATLPSPISSSTTAMANGILQKPRSMEKRSSYTAPPSPNLSPFDTPAKVTRKKPISTTRQASPPRHFAQTCPCFPGRKRSNTSFNNCRAHIFNAPKITTLSQQILLSLFDISQAPFLGTSYFASDPISCNQSEAKTAKSLKVISSNSSRAFLQISGKSCLNDR